ncbi:ATP-dependent DNA ligase Cdc17, partial [Coemansia helicoidea]
MKQSMIATFFGGGMAKNKAAADKEPGADREASGEPAKAAPEQPEGEAGDDKPHASDDAATATAATAAGGATGVDYVRRGCKRLAVSSDDSDSSTDMDADEKGQQAAEEDADDSDSGSDSGSSSEDEPVAKMPKSAPGKARGKAGAKPAAKKAKAQAVTLPTSTIELIDTSDGKQVSFATLCAVFEEIDATTKRLEITALTRDFLYKVMAAGQAQLRDVVMACINK